MDNNDQMPFKSDDETIIGPYNDNGTTHNVVIGQVI